MSVEVKAYKYWLEGNFAQAANYYELAIQNSPILVTNYCYLGLAYLLQKQEELAQTTWLLPMREGTELEIRLWVEQLVQILEAESRRQETINNYRNCWHIRQSIRRLAPNRVDNVLELILLSFKLDTFEISCLEDYNVLSLIKDSESEKIDSGLILRILYPLLKTFSSISLAFLDTSLIWAKNKKQWLESLIKTAAEIADQDGQVDFAIQAIEIFSRLEPLNSGVLQQLCLLYDKAANYTSSLKIAKILAEKGFSSTDRLLGTYLVTDIFIRKNGWIDSGPYIDGYKRAMKDFIVNGRVNDESEVKLSLISTSQLLAYIQDSPSENAWFQNNLARIFENNLKQYRISSSFPGLNKSRKTLRIGYIGHTFRVHSVGWLSRWLLNYHDKNSFHTTIYFVNQDSENSFSKIWFKNKSSSFRSFQFNPQAVADQIEKDGIDILIDLDSTTSNGTCMVMAFKPAPVQVTWLGKDASGIPSIDYFIADPYVLPENAQEYYQETIWRLPKTYVAVDGFELDVPTLKREHLGIPGDATIYFTAQSDLKRHPETVRSQMKILKGVKEAHLLVKGHGNQPAVEQLFIQLADREGVDLGRLHFLPMDVNEYVHRANLQIADVILDTYPYNGATTTLEALWVGIPLVTKVGQQFAARNSYSFLMNAGVTEGIAWTDEEYVEWGIRLGTDKKLRQRVAWNLKQSRRTSPLWNARQFTLDMEDAYRQMWAKYIEAL